MCLIRSHSDRGLSPAGRPVACVGDGSDGVASARGSGDDSLGGGGASLPALVLSSSRMPNSPRLDTTRAEAYVPRRLATARSDADGQSICKCWLHLQQSSPLIISERQATERIIRFRLRVWNRCNGNQLMHESEYVSERSF